MSVLLVSDVAAMPFEDVPSGVIVLLVAAVVFVTAGIVLWRKGRRRD